MSFSPLNAISPIDGRYNSKTLSLQSYFSEASLIRFRVKVEIEYFISLCNSSIIQLNHFPNEKFKNLRNLYRNFSENDAIRIKEIEAITNHDVKAVEYFIKEEFEKLSLSEFNEFIHFGLTSHDINNTAIPYSIKKAVEEILLPQLNMLLEILEENTKKWKDVSMLARTHGQAASPTKMGKEIKVFTERIQNQIKLLKLIPYTAKFGGATGNFNAHHVAFPEIDWIQFANDFTSNSLGLTRQQTTTQIEHYDNLAALMDTIARVNNILIDYSRDVWTYISMDYFKQTIKEGEVGSSAMPHKVNPIDFENAEGNLMLANSLFSFLSEKLPISRLQRDLTDSTVSRNIGLPIAYTILAHKSLSKGIKKLDVDINTINKDLNNNWAVVSEAIQTILRRENIPNPYELLKDLTRGNTEITKDSILKFINNLPVNIKIKKELNSITPNNYLGNSNKI